MEINIWDFVDQKVDELQKFKQEWLENITTNPECYPTKLPLGDWEEQLNATVSIWEQRNND